MKWTSCLAEWLSQTTHFPTHIALHGESPQPGQAYLAPDDQHMGVDPHGRIMLSLDAPEGALRPAVSYLFRSVTRVFGRHSLGVLLTGMGEDGADELKTMKEQGAITMAQDRESSVVHGMPGAAIQRGAALFVLSPEEIVTTLLHLLKVRP